MICDTRAFSMNFVLRKIRTKFSSLKKNFETERFTFFKKGIYLRVFELIVHEILLDFAGRLGRAESLSLTIHSVTAEDEGVYACSVTKFSRLAPTAPLSGPPLKLVIHGERLALGAV